MGLSRLFDRKGEDSCLCTLAIIFGILCVLGDDIFDCLGNLDLCSILCIVLFVLTLCGGCGCDRDEGFEPACHCG